MTREFLNPDVSRSGLDRCLRRQGVSPLQALIPQPEADEQPTKTFKDYEPGFVHVDVKSLPRRPDADAHRALFGGINRASHGVYVAMLGETTAGNAAGFLRRRVAPAPCQVQNVLTDKGQEVTARVGATGERAPTGRHRYDRTGDSHGIDHRLIQPRHPQTNGRVERCKGRIGAGLATTRCDAAQRLADTLSR